MADAVTSQIIGDNVGAKSILVKLTNISDGSGESAVAKVDVSTLAKDSNGESCSRVAIQEIYYDINCSTECFNLYHYNDECPSDLSYLISSHIDRK